MKKKLAKVLTAGVMTFCMVGCSSTTTEVIKAGTILENPKDNLTSAERNNLRSKVIADQMWKNYYDEELNGAINYYPYKDDTEEIASVWHFTSILSLYIKLVKNNPNDAELKRKLNTVLEGLEYYHERRTDYRAYAVKRGVDIDMASSGYMADVYDDNMWIAREFLNAYETLNDESLLTKCEETIEYCLTGWDSSINSDTGAEWGGIYWGPDYLSKHACSNGPIISTLVRLSKINPDKVVNGRTYLQWAKDVYDFGLKTFKMSNDLYGDMIGTEKSGGVTTSHGSLDTTAYTYNTGTMISGGAYLYEATKDEKYLNQAKKSMKASFEYFGDDEVLNGYYQFPLGTTIWFNLTLFQGYYDLLLVDDSASEYLALIQKSIDFAYNNYLYDNYLPVNWVSGWQYGLTSDENKDVMDVCASAEIYALLSMKDSLNK